MSRRHRHSTVLSSVLLACGLSVFASIAVPGTARAFCGFYVSGADADMFNNATQVVIMREGTRTVLSMQNNYQGPPENFAMVVPVPVVLQEDNVKTLSKTIFERVDQLAAPRLVEYWEQDPCAPAVKYDRMVRKKGMKAPSKPSTKSSDKEFGVTVEAQFTVGEYNIVILSAKDASGLDSWLKHNKYKIPDGAAPLLRPYVQAGSKFFVAKVDTTKVTFKDGMAMLSPLRFHYDTDTFALPVRLGMINSAGVQDLIVHILAKGKRYEVANYKNVTIPTNLDVKDDVRHRFGEFYAALFDATLEKNPGAVVTEYSWDASSCDPCPSPPLSPNEVATLGADVLFGATAAGGNGLTLPTRPQARRRPVPRGNIGGFVLTRLHVRYGKGSLADDLVFKEAPSIAGGREWNTGDGLEQGAVSSPSNNFQGRYAIRHEWTGAIDCPNPQRGNWGGPPAGTPGTTQPTPALQLAFAPRGKMKLASMVARDIPEIGVAAGADSTPQSEIEAAGDDTGNTIAIPTTGTSGATGDPAGATSEPAKQKTSKGCAATSTPGPGTVFLMFLVLLLVAPLRRTRRAVRGML